MIHHRAADIRILTSALLLCAPGVGEAPKLL